MAAALIPDKLRELIAPFLPPPTPGPKGGRPRVPDRACLNGIMFVLRGGIPWETLPQELGCGSGMTCWRRVRDWQEAGIWGPIHFALLELALFRIRGYGECANRIRAALRFASRRAVRGAEARPVTNTATKREPCRVRHVCNRDLIAA